MTKEQVRGYLNDDLLTQAIEAKMAVQEIRRKLSDAYQLAIRLEMSSAARSEIDAELKKYTRIENNYTTMIEDSWGLNWQKQSTISKHVEL